MSKLSDSIDLIMKAINESGQDKTILLKQLRRANIGLKTKAKHEMIRKLNKEKNEVFEKLNLDVANNIENKKLVYKGRNY